ncbi:MAG: glycine betaine ABC transporter substrate-binding protein [Ostreibacterium sp.]
MLRIGQIDLSFHRVVAAGILAYFDKIEQPYELHTATHEEIFSLYRKGEIDMVLSAWLPSSHGHYIESVEAETEKTSTLYTPYCIWGVPDYLPENIKSISDVAEHSDPFIKKIQGINEGAGISRFSRNIIKEYNLDKLGFTFSNGSISDCTDAFINAYQKKQWVIIPLWQPQYLFHTYNIRELAEPKGLLGTIDNATLIIKKESLHKLNQQAKHYIYSVSFGNEKVTEMDYQYQVEKLPLTEIGKQYAENTIEIK